ncbi:hypothetical protein Bca52824_033435 [Brassica carinata]|uniref:Uncharacterized protein n=1 Tax=Brassica carinata TaxID=52824 RepID=A0A8X7V729_BRACI|nr:hypothetical protein Bca52824_033435 [Brassica carinata]
MYGGASYFHKNPLGGEYTVFAGSKEAFCDYLRGLDCSDVEVYGIPEGKAFRWKTTAVWLWNLQLIRQAGRRVKNNNISCLQVRLLSAVEHFILFKFQILEHFIFIVYLFPRFGVRLSDGVAYVCRKKPQQTYLPTIPVVKLIPSGEFPECEIQQHKDEVAAQWTRLIGGEASEGGSGGEACGLGLLLNGHGLLEEKLEGGSGGEACGLGESGVGDMAKAILGFTKAYEKAETAKSPPPPSQPLLKQLKMDESGESGVGDMAKAILGFTKAYEKAETAKVKLMLKLRKERMKFVKEMEL